MDIQWFCTMVFMSAKESEIRQNTMDLHLNEILDHNRRLQTKWEESLTLDTSNNTSIAKTLLQNPVYARKLVFSTRFVFVWDKFRWKHPEMDISSKEGKCWHSLPYWYKRNFLEESKKKPTLFI